MSCFHPNVGINLGIPGEKIKAFGKSTPEYRQHLLDIVDNFIGYGGFENEPFVQEVPCKKCLSCRLSYSLNWAMRLMDEYKTCGHALFVTLTYDDDHLPLLQPFNRPTLLSKSQFKNKMKVLREVFRRKLGQTVRYYMCAEYGSLYHRPHYHIIFFGLDLPDLELLKVTKCGSRIYTSKILQSGWKYGFSSVGDVTANTCAYVARYCLKKQIDSVFYDGRVQEWVNMSNRDAIGKSYALEHLDDIYKTDSVNIKFNKGVITLKPCSYYDRLYDIDHHEDLQRIKETREILARSAMVDKLSKTDMSIDRIRQIEEEEKLFKMKFLHREFEEEG